MSNISIHLRPDHFQLTIGCRKSMIIKLRKFIILFYIRIIYSFQFLHPLLPIRINHIQERSCIRFTLPCCFLTRPRIFTCFHLVFESIFFSYSGIVGNFQHQRVILRLYTFRTRHTNLKRSTINRLSTILNCISHSSRTSFQLHIDILLFFVQKEYLHPSPRIFVGHRFTIQWIRHFIKNQSKVSFPHNFPRSCRIKSIRNRHHLLSRNFRIIRTTLCINLYLYKIRIVIPLNRAKIAFRSTMPQNQIQNTVFVGQRRMCFHINSLSFNSSFQNRESDRYIFLRYNLQLGIPYHRLIIYSIWNLG